jgi:transposase
MPIRAIITDGTTADCTKAGELIRDIKAKYLLADKGYDSNEIINLARKRKMVAVIPPRSNRKEKRYHYRELYKKRHKVENAFLKMKQWRGIATRYSKNIASYQAAVQICCIMMWGRLI